MLQIPFTKLSTLGNNYLFIDCRFIDLPPLNFSDLAQRMTNQDTGISSDGIILISNSSQADVKMTIFNQDGSKAKTCGNGLRMTGRYLKEKSHDFKAEYLIETDANVASVTVDENQFTADLGCPSILDSSLPWPLLTPNMDCFTKIVFTDTDVYRVDPISMGNPHYILYTTKDHSKYVHELRKLSEKHDVNIGLLTPLSHTEMKLTTYERGAGYTGACGTNTAAAVASAFVRGHIEADTLITMHLPGGDLFMTYTSNHHLLATQSTDLICEGVYYYSH